MYLAQNLKYLREQNGEQQKELAQLLDISESTISKYESGFIEPDIKKIVVISRHYKISLDDLVLKDLRPPISLYSVNTRYLRMRNGITQEQIAELLELKHKSSLSLIESGKSGISVENLEKLADFFGVTMDQMVKQDLSKGDMLD